MLTGYHSEVLKKLRRAREQLAPGADIHRARNVEDLTNATSDMLTLLADLQLPITIPAPITEMLSLISKAIIQKKRVRPTQKKKKRPQVQVEGPLDDFQTNGSSKWEEFEGEDE